MSLDRRSILTLAIAGLSATALPAAAGNVAWSVSVGGPGFAVSAGQPAFGPAVGPGFRPWATPIARPFVPRVAVRPIGFRPVVVARPAWVSPPVFLAPQPVFFAPRPVFFAPRPVVAPRFVVAPRPFVPAASFRAGSWYH